MKQKYLAAIMLISSLTIYSASIYSAEDTSVQPPAMPTLNQQQPPAMQPPPGTSPQNPAMPPNHLRTLPNQQNQTNPSNSNNGIQGTGAEGGSRMTVIDENGNLKMVETPKSNAPEAVISHSATTSPGMNQAAPTGQASQSITPGTPTDSSGIHSKPKPPSSPNGMATPSTPSGMEPPVPLNNPSTENNLNQTAQ